jgi:hypothetical protein
MVNASPFLNVDAGEAVAARIASYPAARSKLDEARRMVVANDAVRGSEPCPHTGNPWKLRVVGCLIRTS